MSKDTQYAYAVARIRSVERHLLDKGKLERMLEAKSAEEAVKVLVEANYGTSAAELSNPLDYERLLKEEHRKVFRLLKEISPKPELFDIFLLRNDYHNGKVLLKAEFMGNEQDDLLIESGSIAPLKMKGILRDRKLSELPPIMRKAVEECIDLYNRTGDPQWIDTVLDRACYQQMNEMAQVSDSSFLSDLTDVMADLANIQLFLRVGKMKKSWDYLQRILLPGGKVRSKVFVEHLGQPTDQIVEALKYTPYAAIVEQGVEAFAGTGSLTTFEKLADNYITTTVRKSKYISFGMEPLIGYLVAKENEIKNVRIIMVGKINKINTDRIRERLREAYV
jgi:V/A-type H+/Na+-transporting ATPase subunit C